MWFFLAEEAQQVYVVIHSSCSSSQALQALFQPLQRGQSIKVKEIMTEEVTAVTPSPSPPPTSHLRNPHPLLLTLLSSLLLTPPSLSPPSTHHTLSRLLTYTPPPHHFSLIPTLSLSSTHPIPFSHPTLSSSLLIHPTLSSPSTSHTLLSLHTP